MSYYSNNRETDRSCSHGGSNRIVVGITSRSSEQDLQWLMDFIRSTFRDHVSYVKYLPVSNSNRVDWERNVRTCSVVILYHTKRQGRINITDVDGGLYDEELQILSTTPGRSKVLVVLDDLENCSDAEKQRILVTQPSLQRFSSELFLFPEEGKYEEAMKKKGEFIKLLGIKAAARDPQPNTAKAKAAQSATLNSRLIDTGSKKISKALSIDFTSKQPQPRLKISMFSRSAESNYGWLTEWLKTTYMTRPVDVRAVYISNTASPFYTELSHCSFAILYHTKKQGRINITDVTDNLYDEELRDLSTNLGKENVIVVIDDLQNDNSSEKERILRSQPSIGRLARGLFLFNEKKKNSENLEEINQILKKKIPRSEVPGDDYRRDTAARNYNDSSMAAKYPGRAHSQDSSVDKEPTPSWSQPPESRRNPDNVTAHNTSRKRAEDSGPEAKRRNLLPIGPTPQSSQAIAEVENAIRKANACFILSSEANSAVYQKWLEYQQIQEEESRDMARKIQRLQRENEELQSRNSDLVMKMTENEDNQKQLLESIEKLHKDLCDKDKIIEESRCKMEDKINELKKELREKEELGIQIRNQAERAIEKLHQDRHKYQKIIEENEDTIRKMEAKIQQLQNDNHARETNPRQKQAGHGAQRYNVRSPIPGEEAEETSSNQDMKKCEWKEEGSPRARTQQNTEMSNPRQKPAETQSPREAEEQIEELRRRVQQKDEEIQKMKTLLQIHETVINDLLEASDGGKKPKS